MTISEWLAEIVRKLRASGIDSARLDAELILAHALGKSREWLAAHSDKIVAVNTAVDLVERRLAREPFAYILGKKEFYGREFVVTPNVLIPRPETEQVIEIVKKLFRKDSQPIILDVGTGSGAIAITLALELPDAQIFASDINDQALSVTKQNAKTLGAKVNFIKSDLLQNICNKKFDIIVANLPYVARDWKTSPETAYEPEIALFADDGGLKFIKKLLRQTPEHLNPDGFLVLELDPRQSEDVKKIASKYGFVVADEQPFSLTLQSRRVPETAKHK
ncbi:MAG: peptide chain release factor N(5)-glutamine methyltransferase [Candidatus Nomurabacteria bacterium]|jgi:release factor glutamine methyltransferase|nr:peptide chain release factor N(5)-glutamine methyltransferase [Candidatus Nomurabacteria bacterium]